MVFHRWIQRARKKRMMASAEGTTADVRNLETRIQKAIEDSAI